MPQSVMWNSQRTRFSSSLFQSMVSRDGMQVIFRHCSKCLYPVSHLVFPQPHIHVPLFICLFC